jgi:hypothetical protein
VGAMGRRSYVERSSRHSSAAVGLRAMPHPPKVGYGTRGFLKFKSKFQKFLVASWRLRSNPRTIAQQLTSHG